MSDQTTLFHGKHARKATPGFSALKMFQVPQHIMGMHDTASKITCDKAQHSGEQAAFKAMWESASSD